MSAIASISAAAAASRYKRTTRQTMSQEKAKKAPLTQVEQRMAFYAKILKNGQLMLNEEEAAEWRRDLPVAIQGQHIILDRGELPVAMTLANVRRLKTLALKNA